MSTKSADTQLSLTHHSSRRRAAKKKAEMEKTVGSKRKRDEHQILNFLVVPPLLTEEAEASKQYSLGYNVPFPLEWKFAENHAKFRKSSIQIVNLLPSDEQFQRVAALFYEGLPCRECAEIVCIEQIQNLKQLYKYSVEKHDMEQEMKYSRLPYPLERQLWHGTSLKNLHSLLLNGFDKGFSRRSMYGKGFYFSKKTRIAGQENYAKTFAWDLFHLKLMEECRKPQCHQKFHYVNQKQDETCVDAPPTSTTPPTKICVIPEIQSGCKVLLLCKVLTGKVQMLDDNNNLDRMHPSASYHSVGSLASPNKNIGDMDYMVSFHPDYVYPEYICYFESNNDFAVKHKVFMNLDKIVLEASPPLPTPSDAGAPAAQPPAIPSYLDPAESGRLKQSMAELAAKHNATQRIHFDKEQKKKESERFASLLSWTPPQLPTASGMSNIKL